MFGSMAEEAKGAKEKVSKEQGMASDVGSKPGKGAIITLRTKVVQ